MYSTYEKNKAAIGNEYYTYYIETTNKGNRLRYYTGIIKVKLVSVIPSEHTSKGVMDFEIIESKKLGETLARNLKTYMNSPTVYSMYFYNNKQDCILEHDEEIKRIAKGQSTNDRERILKKLINTNSKPKVNPKEINVKKWFNQLDPKEKKYVRWIKQYWDEV